MMAGKDGFLVGIEHDIQDILYRYIKAQSFTYTEREKEAEQFLMGYLSEIQYFKDHPQYFGVCQIPDDSFDRAVCYAMVRGEGAETVVLLHHSDVVEIEDFKLLKSYAFSPDELAVELLKVKDQLPEDARNDLIDDTFLFGRGTADMKGGGAIQLALLKRYSECVTFKGNIIVLAVPDEENLSAGMRTGVELLAELKDKYGLDYKLMINSEPHQRKNFLQGIFSEGSVGKVMPFVYARGYLSHIGKVFEGLNPINLLSEIVRKTELNMHLSDVVGDESAPPPTWLYFKDSKKQYDVSMPLSAAGCFSILTLNRTPADIIDGLDQICQDAFDVVLDEMKQSYQRFSEVADPVAQNLPWKKVVMDFAALYEEAYENHGEAFRVQYERTLEYLSQDIREGNSNIVESNFKLVEFVFDYINDLAPRIVYGLIPPYYPDVSNSRFDTPDPDIETLADTLSSFTKCEFDQVYTREFFYTGISDLSYTSIRDGQEILDALGKTMPLLGEFYTLPVSAIETISMPCMNIGPWGKDFHKLTERVCKEDLYSRTPRILNKAVSLLLKNENLVK